MAKPKEQPGIVADILGTYSRARIGIIDRLPAPLRSDIEAVRAAYDSEALAGVPKSHALKKLKEKHPEAAPITVHTFRRYLETPRAGA